MLSRATFARSYGRDQAPEQITILPFAVTATSGTQNIFPQQNISLDRPLMSLKFNVRFRVVIAVANQTPAAEAPQTIFERLRVFGQYKKGAQTPYDISGATLFALPRHFNLRGGSIYINGVLQPELGIPNAQTAANFGNTGTYDVSIWYDVPMGPYMGKSSRTGFTQRYFYRSADWGQSLQMQLTMGDGTSLFGALSGGGTATFSQFGSGAGNPTVTIYADYALMGKARPENTGERSALILRSEQPASTPVTALTNNARLFALNKEKTTWVLLRTGLSLAGVSGGIHAFASLDDGILDITQIKNAGKLVRNNSFNESQKEHMMQTYETVIPQGSLVFSFIGSQTPRTAYRADLPTVVANGGDFAIYSSILKANAANIVNILQEQIFADQDDPYWNDDVQ